MNTSRYGYNRSRQFTNTQDGFRALIEWMGHQSVVRITYESTGPYHRAFERALAIEGLPLSKVNPKQARRFAEATGKLAKTDRVDAAMLARMGITLQTNLLEPVSQTTDEMREFACSPICLNWADWTKGRYAPWLGWHQ